MIGVHLTLDGVFEPPFGEDDVVTILSELSYEISMKILFFDHQG